MGGIPSPSTCTFVCGEPVPSTPTHSLFPLWQPLFEMPSGIFPWTCCRTPLISILGRQTLQELPAHSSLYYWPVGSFHADRKKATPVFSWILRREENTLLLPYPPREGRLRWRVRWAWAERFALPHLLPLSSSCFEKENHLASLWEQFSGREEGREG